MARSIEKKYGIPEFLVMGEQSSADHVAAAEYISEFADVVAAGNYSPQELYNANETGLNFKALPKKNLPSKKEKNAPGFKMSKERVTVLVCSNAAGTYILSLMVIGKLAKPRAFKNLNIKSLS